MYILFWNQLTKVFILREAKSAEAHELPENGDGSWTVIDDSVMGRLDAFALIAQYASDSGWRRYEISIE